MWIRDRKTPLVYVLENCITPAIVSTTYANKQLNSIFGSVTLGYNKYLYLTATGRNDWASTLKQTGNFSYFYPSISGSFVFSDVLPQNSWLALGLSLIHI